MELVFRWDAMYPDRRGVHVERVRLEPEVAVLISYAIHRARWTGDVHLVQVDYLDPAHMESALEVRVVPIGDRLDEYGCTRVEVRAASMRMRYTSEPLSSSKVDKVLDVARAYDEHEVVDYPEVVQEYMHKAVMPYYG